MYVRKFEAETMDEALKDIKRELGPDAIILKTVSNKGLKSTFSKNKIEITAAISEKNYTKKAKVDHVLTTDENKTNFYSNSSSYISNMIDEHSEHSEPKTSQYEVKNEGYGSMGLNRKVKTVKDIGKKIKTGLDEFLSSGAGETVDELGIEEVLLTERKEEERETTQYIEEEAPLRQNRESRSPQEHILQSNYDEQIVQEQREKIDLLERKIYELSRTVEKINRREPLGLYQLRTTLRSLGINEHYIQEVTKKAVFEMNDEELEDADLTFEFALREMLGKINTEMPMFSSLEAPDSPVITILLSETSCGQTSTLFKLAALKKDAVLIKDEATSSFAEKVFEFQTETAKTVPEIISATRKVTESGRSAFIDYKNRSREVNETKKFIDGLKRAFGRVEVLICLSSIHAEIYNRKVIERYGSLADGIVITNLDLCLNYGSLFNLSEEYGNLPYKFFGTGEVVPEDLETATAERILAGMFQFS